MNKLNIIGASGHGKVVANIAELMGYKDIVFFDDNEFVRMCDKWPVIGKNNEVSEGEVFVAIGDSEIREKITRKYADRIIPVLKHPNAVVAEGVIIEAGTVIMAGAVINSGARLGRGVIVNTCSSVDHDCVIGDFSHIAVGAHLCGTVNVGENVWIGAGATVINNIKICSACVIGAGATVINDIQERGTYVGVPVKRINIEEKSVKKCSRVVQ